MVDEVIAIWKPKDISSYDVVKQVKLIKKSKQVGHCGTLDPFAEGILVVCIGKYTKNVDDFMNCTKRYKAKILLGVETDTLDIEGEVIREDYPKNITKHSIKKTLSTFKGSQNQIPPYFCAKKIHGVKMYKLARKDIFIKRKPNNVYIEDIDFIDYSNKILTLSITCGKGTYIRSLSRDIAYSLGTYGHLIYLERYQVGDFNKNNSITLKELKYD